jgi:hypothetical protein
MSALKKLTRLGSDTKKIAALLQAKAPKGHMLAYINPEEAALLKSRGGKGTPHADTGIPSYEIEDIGLAGTDIEVPADVQAEFSDIGPSVGGGFDISAGGGGYSLAAPQVSTGLQMGGDLGLQAPAGGIETPSIRPPTGPAYDLTSQYAGAAAEEPRAPTAGKGMSEDTLKRLGLAGALGVLGAGTARRAGAVGQRGAQQMQAMAAPYQKQGQDLQAAAQRGELTPAAQQSLQALRAREAQGAERRGGVGVAQAEARIEAFRQQLLQQQYDYGLKLSGIGDNIALGAIKTGLQADQYVNQLTNSFYTNMAYIASGMAPGIRI